MTRATRISRRARARDGSRRRRRSRKDGGGGARATRGTPRDGRRRAPWSRRWWTPRTEKNRNNWRSNPGGRRVEEARWSHLLEQATKKPVPSKVDGVVVSDTTYAEREMALARSIEESKARLQAFVATRDAQREARAESKSESRDLLRGVASEYAVDAVGEFPSQTRGVPRVGQAGAGGGTGGGRAGGEASSTPKRAEETRRDAGTGTFFTPPRVFFSTSTRTRTTTFRRGDSRARAPPSKSSAVAVIHSGDTFTMSAALGLNVSAHLGTGRSPRAVRGVRRAASAPARRGRSVIRRGDGERAHRRFALTALVGGWRLADQPARSVRAAAVEGTLTPKVLGAAYSVYDKRKDQRRRAPQRPQDARATHPPHRPSATSA